MDLTRRRFLKALLCSAVAAGATLPAGLDALAETAGKDEELFVRCFVPLNEEEHLLFGTARRLLSAKMDNEVVLKLEGADDIVHQVDYLAERCAWQVLSSGTRTKRSIDNG